MSEENRSKAQKLFTYHLLRYTPDLVRDEWLNTPAPILVEGARELFHLLHPKLPARALPLKPGARGVPAK